ncbi:MAG: nitrite/sulfite reductase [Rhodospirillaceae bacterium]|jgi:sulfite reductase (NADPH) hemoprotein beta-component|nr:nitrite/sulfite reductase [Rhodospirillaceae bacterium]MBT5458842.1 nitrite/sulfite reductase [Rhodospirillaceae bacterium]
MYRYDEFDNILVHERVDQFRDQVARRLSGELTEEQFRPLRLMNGLYLQLHAYMLRVAIPYGTLAARQMRMLAHIARKYDRGYGHFTTRQNIQYNWPRLEEVPDLLAELATVEMHAIQTSGNCIRNVTADHYAGAAAEEIEDPRIYAEIIRQWSTLHPEFSFLPRKFKIALAGGPIDRAAVRFHDIGLHMRKNARGEVGFEVLVGGGQGRTPIIAATIRKFLPKQDLLSYLEAILRVYNLLGRRDNIYKARIKILVRSTGAEKFASMVEREWETIRGGDLDLPDTEISRIRAYFAPPAYELLSPRDAAFEAARRADREFDRWAQTNVAAHKQPGYAIANISLKPEGGAPGDATADQMDVIADLAEEYSLDELRITHQQNIVLAHVRQSNLHALWQRLDAAGLATANIDLATDIIACPGLDYCNLANARSIPVAQRLSRHLSDPDLQTTIGALRIKISGCINACGHHHVGDIGILGVDRKGTECYQITLGGSPDENAAIGEVIGPAFAYDDVVDAIDRVIGTYLFQRTDGELFGDTYRRVGPRPFKEDLYGTA